MKKKQVFHNSLMNYRKKALLVMKCLSLFLVLFSFYSFTDLYSQNTKLKIDLKEATLIDMIKEIEKQSEFVFIYNDEILPELKKVRGDIQFKNRSIQKVLDRVLDDNKLIYSINERQVILNKNTLFSTPINSQQNIISGMVKDDAGIPLAGVNIIKVGTSTGTQSDFDGNYSINAEKGDQLTFSYVGMETVTVTVEDNNTINVTMLEDTESLNEVIVTALGISRERKSLGYAVTEVTSEELTKVGSPNVVASLYGKAPGVQIKSNPGGVTAGVNVLIRGVGSLGSTNQPLFIVDGIPIEHGDSDYSRWGGSNSSNGAADINPEDIESLSVLKGGAASALYGSKASNGVVIITTKSGNLNKKGLGVEFVSNATFDKVAYLPNYQNEYGSGFDSQVFRTNAAGENIYHNTWPSFGPKMEGQMLRWWDGELRPYSPQPDNIKDIYQTGHTITNTLAISKATKDYSYRLSYTNLGYEGIFPGVKQKRNVFSLNSKIKLNDKLDVSFVGNFYDITTTNRPPLLSGLNAYEYPRSTKLDLLKENYKQDGYYNGQISGNSAPGMVRNFMSFLWNANENNDEDKRGRLVGNVTLDYQPFTNVNVRARVGTDLINTNSQNETASRNPVNSGQYREGFGKTQLDYFELLTTYNKDINEDINLALTAGGSISKQKHSDGYVRTNGGLIVPNWFSLKNSARERVSDGNRDAKRVDALFGVASFSYKNMVFLEATGRNDWSSTLPHNNQSFFYPSVSGSFVFSDLLSEWSWLDYAKVRASWANTGNDTGSNFYRANKVYSYGNYNGAVTNTFSNSVPPTNLVNENSLVTEFGIEARTLNNRLGFDLTYYKERRVDQIIPLDIPLSSGASSTIVNAGELANSGIELQINALPIETENFSWRTIANFAKNKNEVVELAQGIDQLFNQSNIGGAIRNLAKVGVPYGQWEAYTYQTDDNGNRVIDGDGLYVRDDSERVPVGNSTPDLIGGFTNILTYKGFTLNAHIDFVVGGDIFSFTNYYGTNAGKLEESLKYRDERNGGLPYYKDTSGNLIQLPSHTSPSPNGPVYHDGVILDGVTSDGQPNTTLIDAFDYYINTYYWNFGFHEEGLFDNSYVKLREVSLKYEFNNSVTDKLGIDNLELALIGRNLFYIYKNVPNIDPEAVLGSSAGEASAVDLGSQPGSRSLGLSLRISL